MAHALIRAAKYKGRPVRPPLESTEEQKFVKAARAAGCLTRKLNGAGNRDWPDQLVLVPGGAILLIEFKRKGKKLRPTQAAWHAKAVAIGVEVYIAWTWLGAYEIMEKHYVRPGS